jgi:hypothetical protein
MEFRGSLLGMVAGRVFELLSLVSIRSSNVHIHTLTQLESSVGKGAAARTKSETKRKRSAGSAPTERRITIRAVQKLPWSWRDKLGDNCADRSVIVTASGSASVSGSSASAFREVAAGPIEVAAGPISL